jgi:surfactin synthase thioesterase subunit
MSFDSLFKKLCGEKIITNSAGAQALAPFAFVSNLAGALLALELLRFCSPRTKPTNYFFVGAWNAPVKAARRIIPKNSSCEFCSDPLKIKIMKEKWPERFR